MSVGEEILTTNVLILKCFNLIFSQKNLLQRDFCDYIKIIFIFGLSFLNFSVLPNVFPCPFGQEYKQIMTLLKLEDFVFHQNVYYFTQKVTVQEIIKHKSS